MNDELLSEFLDNDWSDYFDHNAGKEETDKDVVIYFVERDGYECDRYLIYREQRDINMYGRAKRIFGIPLIPSAWSHKRKTENFIIYDKESEVRTNIDASLFFKFKTGLKWKNNEISLRSVLN